MDLFSKVKKTIETHNLIKNGETVLIALSGGADSVCLLHVLHRMGINIKAAHMNHCLREKDADEDELFVVNLCRSMDVECFVRRENVRDYSKKEKISEESAGRELRYNFFDEIAKTYKTNKIATAHHRNDNAETVLLHFLRGSGIGGLCGIPYKRENIIRPLLDCTRLEIEDYCNKMGLEYVTDKTNFDNLYMRNKIRLDLIPFLEEYNPNIVETITKNASIITDDKDFLDKTALYELKRIETEKGIDLFKFNKLHRAVQRHIIMIKCKQFLKTNITSDHIEDILNLARGAKSGKRIELPNKLSAKVEFGFMRIEKALKTKDFCYEFKDNMYIPECNMNITFGQGESFDFPDNAKLVVRSRKEGDIFYPTGMLGKKKVKDYFIEKKIPADMRRNIPILECNGEIAWIIGYRRDRRFLGNKIKIKAEING